ncbi:MAG TPA: CRISPR-associated ring nuclease [Ktedonobacteraceae bacterium]
MQEHTGAKHILVATLGGQPQVVTFTLDLLLRRGVPIYEVIVVHPASSPALQPALERLRAEFVDDSYIFDGQSRTIHFRRKVLTHYDSVIDDIVDETTANGTLDTIGELIRGLKQEGRIIHFSISGGRRLMAFLSFSAALLYFDTPDELLHLYTPEHIKAQVDHSAQMHISPGSGQCLIAVPFARAVQPLLSSLLNRPPSATIQTQREQMQREEEQRCTQVVNKLTDKPLQVLRLLARGLHPNEAADKLGIKPSTINTHTNTIYRECRNAWNLPATVQVNYLFVHARFAGYFPSEESVPVARGKKIHAGWEKK